QLLAGEQPDLAGSQGPAVHAATRVPSLSGIPGAGLALRTVEPDEILSRQPLLAGPVLRSWKSGAEPRSPLRARLRGLRLAANLLKTGPPVGPRGPCAPPARPMPGTFRTSSPGPAQCVLRSSPWECRRRFV